jgi:transposase-like protein
MARYGQGFKRKAVARLLPPENASLAVVAHDVGIGAHTLERWRTQVMAEPAREPAWSASARLDAVIVTAAMDEVARNVWCREHGVFPQQIRQWQDHATQALTEPGQGRVNDNKQLKKDSLRIKELERELHRKDKALAETAALLVLSKKVAAIFNKGEDE